MGDVCGCGCGAVYDPSWARGEVIDGEVIDPILALIDVVESEREFDARNAAMERADIEAEYQAEVDAEHAAMLASLTPNQRRIYAAASELSAAIAECVDRDQVIHWALEAMRVPLDYVIKLTGGIRTRDKV